MAEVAENNEDQDEYSNLSGTQKCAILMMLLGEEEAAARLCRRIFSQLDVHCGHVQRPMYQRDRWGDRGGGRTCSGRA